MMKLSVGLIATSLLAAQATQKPVELTTPQMQLQREHVLRLEAEKAAAQAEAKVAVAQEAAKIQQKLDQDLAPLQDDEQKTLQAMCLAAGVKANCEVDLHWKDATGKEVGIVRVKEEKKDTKAK
jgi:predicted NodU family carbamoyl transferase